MPKPHTPFQWCAMDEPELVAHKQGLLRAHAKGVKGLTLRVHDVTASTLEGILARGDRRLGPVIEQAFLTGARFDSWDEQLRMDLWQAAFEAHAIDTQVYLGTLPVGARLPWDHFDIGLEDGFLAREYRKAVQSRLSPPCGKPRGLFVHHDSVSAAEADRRKLVCYDCGIACDLTRMRSERIGFLTRMGALEASQPKPIPDPSPQPNPHPHPAPNPVPDPTPDEHPPPKPGVPTRAARRVRPAQPGGPPQRWRLRYEKTAAAALLGHLDLIRELPRVIRRAGVRTAYTNGFHPKPDMSFGPALSLGVASLDEYLDIKLIDAPAPEELVPRLNAAASGGLRFVSAELLGERAPSVGSTIVGGRYVLALGFDAVEELGGAPALERRVEEFLAKSEARVLRRINGIGKQVDVRALVRSLRIGGEPARALLERAGLGGRAVPLEVEISITQSGSAKLSELMEALLGDAAFPFVAVRSELVRSEPVKACAETRAPLGDRSLSPG